MCLLSIAKISIWTPLKGLDTGGYFSVQYSASWYLQPCSCRSFYYCVRWYHFGRSIASQIDYGKSLMTLFWSWLGWITRTYQFGQTESIKTPCHYAGLYLTSFLFLERWNSHKTIDCSFFTQKHHLGQSSQSWNGWQKCPRWLVSVHMTCGQR